MAENYPEVASSCALSLAAKLARAHLLLDRRETGYLGDDEAIGRLTDALALALEHDPVSVDREARLYKVYGYCLQNRRQYGNPRDPPIAAARVAIKRLISAATISPHDDVLREIKDAFSYIDEDIKPIISAEFTVILGAVLLIDGKVQA